MSDWRNHPNPAIAAQIAAQLNGPQKSALTNAAHDAAKVSGKATSAAPVNLGMAKRHKYGAIATERDGIRFDSILEADRYRELTLLKAAGEVTHFFRQTPIHLPGGTKLVIDFMVFWKGGRITYEDTKGRLTPSFKIKRREVEYLYPFRITILKRTDVPKYEL